MKVLHHVNPMILLIFATLLEGSGDAGVRSAIYDRAGWVRVALFLIGAALLFGYGSFLNLAPLWPRPPTVSRRCPSVRQAPRIGRQGKHFVDRRQPGRDFLCGGVP